MVMQAGQDTRLNSHWDPTFFAFNMVGQTQQLCQREIIKTVFWVHSGLGCQQFTKVVWKASSQILGTMKPMRYPSLFYQRNKLSPLTEGRPESQQALCPGDWCEQPLVMLKALVIHLHPDTEAADLFDPAFPADRRKPFDMCEYRRISLVAYAP